MTYVFENAEHYSYKRQKLNKYTDELIKENLRLKIKIEHEKQTHAIESERLIREIKKIRGIIKISQESQNPHCP